MAAGPGSELGARLPPGVRVHVLHGLRDKSVPPSHAGLYALAIPQAQVQLPDRLARPAAWEWDGPALRDGVVAADAASRTRSNEDLDFEPEGWDALRAYTDRQPPGVDVPARRLPHSRVRHSRRGRPRGRCRRHLR